MAKKKLTFENAIEQLEDIIDKLDDNDIPLLESVELYKKGVELSIFANTSLDTIEQEVMVLSGTTKESFKLSKRNDLSE
jgi:exodeoxyribonuclease VII small subunit